jgi:hypothetical protein
LLTRRAGRARNARVALIALGPFEASAQRNRGDAQHNERGKRPEISHFIAPSTNAQMGSPITAASIHQ